MMLYENGRFAKHPRFRYFALNPEMRWRALQTGRIFVRQHPHDAQLSVEGLRDMVDGEEEAISNCVLHYAASLLTSTALSGFPMHLTYSKFWSTWITIIQPRVESGDETKCILY